VIIQPTSVLIGLIKQKPLVIFSDIRFCSCAGKAIFQFACCSWYCKKHECTYRCTYMYTQKHMQQESKSSAGNLLLYVLHWCAYTGYAQHVHMPWLVIRASNRKWTPCTLLLDALYSEKCKIRAISEDMDATLQGIGDL
jgi:hypothetical protein